TATGYPDLTPKKGLPMAFLGNEIYMYRSGIIIRGVGQYLYDNQPNSVNIFWVGFSEPAVQNVSRGVRVAQASGITGNYALSLLFQSCSGSPSLSIRVAGKSGSCNIGASRDTATQVAVEFRGADLPTRYYINGGLAGEGSVSTGKFEEPSQE